MIVARRLNTIRESGPFQRRADRLLTAEELDDLRNNLAANPHAGALIPGGGGVRKYRMAIGSRGKSAGARVIYYYFDDEVPLYLIYIYLKSEAGDLTKDQLADVADIAKEYAAAARARKARK